MKSSHIGLLMFWIPPTPRSDRRTTGRSGRARERDETNKGSTCSNETKKTPAATQQRKHLRQRNKKSKRRRQQNKESTCGNVTNKAFAATKPTKHLRPTNQTKHNGWCHHLCVCLFVCLSVLFVLLVFTQHTPWTAQVPSQQTKSLPIPPTSPPSQPTTVSNVARSSIVDCCTIIDRIAAILGTFPEDD